MFVVNLKLDFKKILIVCVLVALLAAAIIESGSIKTSSVNSNSDGGSYDYVMDEKNYTKILKDIHENIDMNLGKSVKISGFVFKMPDFKKDYFVCGRNTIVNNEDTIAGFLCQSEDAKTLNDNDWIEITGVIIKGDYNGSMPIIKVGSIKKIDAPSNTFVENTN